MNQTHEAEDVNCFGSIIYIIMPDGVDGLEYVLTKKQIVFGRNTSCEVRIQKTNVSDKHALLSIDDDGLVWLKNLNESTKTYLNGKEINEATMVGHNNVFTIGNNWFRLEYCPEIAAAFSVSKVRERLSQKAALTDITTESNQDSECIKSPIISKEGSKHLSAKKLKNQCTGEVNDRENEPNESEEGTTLNQKEDLSHHVGARNPCLSPDVRRKRKSEVPMSAKTPKTPRTLARRSRGQNIAQNETSSIASHATDAAKDPGSKTPNYLSPVIGKTKKLFSVRSSARAAMRRVSMSIKGSPVVCTLEPLDEGPEEKKSADSEVAALPCSPISVNDNLQKQENHISNSTVKCPPPSTPKHNVRVLLSPNRLPTSVRRSLKRRMQHTPRRKLLPTFQNIASSAAAASLAQISQPENAQQSADDVISTAKDEKLDDISDIVDGILSSVPIIASSSFANASTDSDPKCMEPVFPVTTQDSEQETFDKSDIVATELKIANQNSSSVSVDASEESHEIVRSLESETTLLQSNDVEHLMESHPDISTPTDQLVMEETFAIVHELVDMISTEISREITACLSVHKSAYPEDFQISNAALTSSRIETQCTGHDQSTESDPGADCSLNSEQSLHPDHSDLDNALSSLHQLNEESNQVVTENEIVLADASQQTIVTNSLETSVDHSLNSSALLSEERQQPSAIRLFAAEDEGSLYPKLPRRSLISSFKQDCMNQTEVHVPTADAEGIAPGVSSNTSAESTSTSQPTSDNIPDVISEQCHTSHAENVQDMSNTPSSKDISPEKSSKQHIEEFCFIGADKGTLESENVASNRQASSSDHEKHQKSSIANDALADIEEEHDSNKVEAVADNGALESENIASNRQASSSDHEEHQKRSILDDARADIEEEHDSNNFEAVASSCHSSMPQVTASDIPTSIEEGTESVDAINHTPDQPAMCMSPKQATRICATDSEPSNGSECTEVGVSIGSKQDPDVPVVKNISSQSLDNPGAVHDAKLASSSFVTNADSRCQGFTKQGTRCKKQARDGWCWQHKPASNE